MKEFQVIEMIKDLVKSYDQLKMSRLEYIHPVILFDNETDIISVSIIYAGETTYLSANAIENSHAKYIFAVIANYAKKISSSKMRNLHSVIVNISDEKACKIYLKGKKIPKGMVYHLSVPENKKTSKAADRILRNINESGENGITATDLNNKSRFATAMERRKIIQSLIAQGFISEFSKKDGTKKTTFYKKNTKDNAEKIKSASGEEMSSDGEFQNARASYVPPKLPSKLEQIQKLNSMIQEIPDEKFADYHTAVLSKQVMPRLEKLLPHFPGQEYIARISKGNIENNSVWIIREHKSPELFTLNRDNARDFENALLLGSFKALRVVQSEYNDDNFIGDLEFKDNDFIELNVKTNSPIGDDDLSTMALISGVER